MKMTKRILAIVMAVVTLVSVMGIAVEAADIYVSKLGLGYIVPTNSKGTKNLKTVTLYGDYDYINFYINAKKNDGYYGYEIYADKKYTKLKDSGIVGCDKGKYNIPAKIKLKGEYSTKTYYLVTYAAYVYSDGSIDFDRDSMKEFKIDVKRSASFDDKVVVLKETKNTTKGAYIKWGKLSGASKYYIYRRSITGTKWTKVGTVSSSKDSFTDTSVKNKNGNYIYSVKAINKKGTASRYLYFGLTSLFAKTPSLESVTVKADDYIEVKWENTSSKAKYNIMRKEGSGKWKTIKKNYSGTTYNDGTAKNGKKYTYSVKAVISTDYGTATSSYYANDGKAITLYDAPELKVVDVVETGLRLSWKAVSGVSSYKIMRKPYDGSADWEEVGAVASSVLEFTDTTANIDEEYLYTVRSMGKAFEGSYSSKGVEYVKLGTPTNLRIYEDGYHFKEQRLSWRNATGAREYEIYRKVNSGEWKLFSTRDADYCDQRLYFFDYLGVYQFKVRAKAGEGHYGAFSEPISMEYYPKFNYESIVSDKEISLSWSNYKADSYNLYRKEASQDDSQYVLIANTKESKFVDTSVENDVLYTYQARGVVEGKEQTINLTPYSIGISTTLTGNPRIRTDDNRIRFYDAWQVYGYNFETSQWELLSEDSSKNTKKSHAAYCNDGKYRYSFVFVSEDGMKSIRENNIVDHVWYSTVVDFSAEETADGMKITINNPSPEIVEYEVDTGGSSKIIKTNGASSYTCTFSGYYQGSTDLICPVYTVVAKNANGDASATSKEYWYMDAPEITSVSRTSKGYVKLEIEQYKHDNDDWDGLYIYRKASGESKYTKIKTIETSPDKYGYNYTTYTDKTAKKGVKYTYLVKCYKEYKGEMFISYYNKRTIK